MSKLMSPAIMAIDPSINNMGCAIFSKNKKELLSAALLHPSKDAKSDYMEKSFSLYTKVRHLVEKNQIETIVLEMPEHWDTAGFMSRESGAIQKLVFIAGMVYSLRFSVNVKTVTPRGWKGQLPKDVTRNRLTKFYSPSFYTEDEWKKLDHNIVDAIGLGHWLLYGRV